MDLNKENKENIKKTIAALKEISKTNQKLLIQILNLSEYSAESFSVSELREIPKWSKTAMDLISSILSFQSRLEAKLINFEVKTTRQLENKIKTEDIKDIKKGV